MTRHESKTNILSEVPRGGRVAIVRLRSLGDCVLTTPAIELLHSHRPDLSIAVVVEQRFAEVFAGNPAVQSVLEPQAAVLARWHPSLVLNLHGGTRSMLLTALSQARFRAGFAHHRGSACYNIRIPRAQEILGIERPVHTAEHLASAMFFLGAQRCPVPRASLFTPQTAKPARPYAVIHAVAATAEKTWAADSFIALGRVLQREHGLEPIFIAAPGEDLTRFREFRTVNAPLAETKRLLSQASLFVGNDSGPAHMAAAFGVPVMVLFGPSDPLAWAPWRTPAEVLKAVPIAGIPLEHAVKAVSNLMVPQ